jgi:hypothetical protein
MCAPQSLSQAGKIQTCFTGVRYVITLAAPVKPQVNPRRFTYLYSIIDFMNDPRDNNLRQWLLVIGILLILSFVGLAIVYMFYESTQRVQRAVQPVSDLTNSVSTQVAQALRPTPTIIPDPITIIHQVRALARLETIQYSLEKVITAETRQGTFGFLFGDRLLFVAHGEVIAGVDLAKLEPDDLRLQNGVLYVRLPEPELFVVRLDNERSYVYDRNIGALSRGEVDLETAARRAAEEEIGRAALEGGILETAGQNAENFLYRLFIGLGYYDVIFE